MVVGSTSPDHTEISLESIPVSAYIVPSRVALRQFAPVSSVNSRSASWALVSVIMPRGNSVVCWLMGYRY